MKRPGRPLTLTKVIFLPHHPLSDRLRRVLKAVDLVHSPKNLKPLKVVINRLVHGAVFDAYTGSGPYTIYLNPEGTHPELSLLHELGHFFEWQAIPKPGHGPRSLEDDPLFWDWLDATFVSLNVLRLRGLRDEQPEESLAYREILYLLSPEELWARAYSQYVARKTQTPALLQQIGAENRVVTGTMTYGPYWSQADFLPIENALNRLFEGLGWLK